MTFLQILPDMLVMASVTYLIRMLPLVFVKKKIDNDAHAASVAQHPLISVSKLQKQPTLS